MLVNKTRGINAVTGKIPSRPPPLYKYHLDDDDGEIKFNQTQLII